MVPMRTGRVGSGDAGGGGGAWEAVGFPQTYCLPLSGFSSGRTNGVGVVVEREVRGAGAWEKVMTGSQLG